MKRIATVALVALVVATFARPAEAGRRARRRAAAVAVVAAAAPRPVVVAAAPVVVSRPNVAPALPDLTITEMSSVADVHTIVVKNIGRAGSPQTRLNVNFNRSVDGATIATTSVRVLTLQVNQTVRIRIHWLPTAEVQAMAHVDPDFRVAEIEESNNGRTINVRPPQPLAPLEDVDVWVPSSGAIGLKAVE